MTKNQANIQNPASAAAQPAVTGPEIITVDAHADEVCCDGGDEALGHPKVWYSFDGRDRVSCGYCGRLFVKAAA